MNISPPEETIESGNLRQVSEEEPLNPDEIFISMEANAILEKISPEDRLKYLAKSTEPELHDAKMAYLKTIMGKMGRNLRRVGRNQPCPCGSRKKYKKCCGNVTNKNPFDELRENVTKLMKDTEEITGSKY